MTTDSALTPLGKHFYRIDEDIVYIQFHQNIELKETVEFIKIFEGIYGRYHRLLLVFDLLNATTVDAEARKRFGHWAKNIGFLAAASVGANILQKTISVLMLNAIKLFTKGHFSQAFFDNELEARDWLTKQRAHFEQLRAPSK